MSIQQAQSSWAKAFSTARDLGRLGLRAGPNLLRHNLFAFQPHYDLRHHGPLYCGLNVTLRCNLKCPWCVHPQFPSGHTIDDYEATPDVVDRMLTHPLFRSVIHINLTGGEPLLNPDLFEIARRIRRSACLVGMVSNGLLLEDRADELVSSGIRDVRISVYRNTMDRLAVILPRLRGRVAPASSYIVFRSELHDHPEVIESVVRLCYESGCSATRMNFYMPVGAYGLEEVVYEDDPALHDLKDRLARRFPTYPLYWRGAAKRNITGRADKTCRQLWETFHVDALGNLGLCCKLCTTVEGRGGNLFATATNELFDEPAIRAMRATLLHPSPAVPKDCQGCLYLSGQRAVGKWLASPAPRLMQRSVLSHKTHSDAPSPAP